MFSGRLSWNSPYNRLTTAREKRRQLGLPILDLTETNPTRVGLSYPLDRLEEILARAASQPYEPHPLGLPKAREALASELSRPTDPVSPDDLILCASTSEAYAYLFKLLADPGDAVLTALPTYPLLDHLTSLEAVRLNHYRLIFRKRWSVDLDEIEKNLPADGTRAIVTIHPNNPTGSFLTDAEQHEVADVCRRYDLALISDEVFYDYRFDDFARIAPPAASRDDVLCFSLGGLSKSAGLPHWKLAWIGLGGPSELKQQARRALELIADSYLSVASPVQNALPELLPLGRDIRNQIQERISNNLSFVREISRSCKVFELLPIEGGWSAVLRFPAVKPDEDLAIELLESAGVSVQPGYLFDFQAEGYLVVSLLPECAKFAEGLGLLKEYAEARVG